MDMRPQECLRRASIAFSDARALFSQGRYGEARTVARYAIAWLNHFIAGDPQVARARDASAIAEVDRAIRAHKNGDNRSS